MTKEIFSTSFESSFACIVNLCDNFKSRNNSENPKNDINQFFNGSHLITREKQNTFKSIIGNLGAFKGTITFKKLDAFEDLANSLPDKSCTMWILRYIF